MSFLQNYKNSMLGISLSTPHLEQLNIPIDEAIREACAHHFSHIRLGSYWNRIQPSPTEYDFKALVSMIKSFETAKQSLVMTLGVKAPRWPEFHYPSWVQHKTTNHKATQSAILAYIATTVQRLKQFQSITHWQVENEPLDPSGPDQEAISLDFLKEEIALIRSLDHRPIIVSVWGNDAIKRGFLPVLAPFADVIGLDLYPKQFVGQVFGQNIYKGPSFTPQRLKKQLQLMSKPIWVTELQAEPWEKNEQGYRLAHPKSISPMQLKETIEQTMQLPVSEVLLWGFEYWLWRKQQGDMSYMQLFDC